MICAAALLPAALPNVVLPCSLLGLLVTKPSSAGLQRFTVYTGTCVVLTIALQLLVDARAIVRHAGACARCMKKDRRSRMCICESRRVWLQESWCRGQVTGVEHLAWQVLEWVKRGPCSPHTGGLRL